MPPDLFKTDKVSYSLRKVKYTFKRCTLLDLCNVVMSSLSLLINTISWMPHCSEQLRYTHLSVTLSQIVPTIEQHLHMCLIRNVSARAPLECICTNKQYNRHTWPRNAKRSCYFSKLHFLPSDQFLEHLRLHCKIWIGKALLFSSQRPLTCL